MASSLDALCKNLSREQFREMNKVFEGDTVLLPYIALNTDLRTARKNDF